MCVCSYFSNILFRLMRDVCVCVYSLAREFGVPFSFKHPHQSQHIRKTGGHTQKDEREERVPERKTGEQHSLLLFYLS